MTKGTRNTWLAALLALGLCSGAQVADREQAPGSARLGDSSRAAIAAGRIVARDLSALVADRAQRAASDLVLLGVKQTSRLYRLADRALGSAPGGCCAGSAGGEAAPEAGIGTVVASEPDMPCAPGGCEATAGPGACPPCPACPLRPKSAEAATRGAGAAPGRSGA